MVVIVDRCRLCGLRTVTWGNDPPLCIACMDEDDRGVDPDTVREIRRREEAGASPTAVARDLGIDPLTVWRIARGGARSGVPA